MTELPSILAVLPGPLLWSLTLGIALLLPLLPLAIIRGLQVRDARVERMEQRFDAALPQNGTAVDRVVLLTVADWPSMDEVVYEDASTGPTPVGFEFKADTVAGDIGSALGSRGIEVETADIREVESVEDLDEADLVVVVFPARHEQLPWQLLAFFDEVVEPRVAAYEPALAGIPFAALALGDQAADIEAGLRHIERMEKRYDLTLRGNAGLIDTPDRLALYDRTLGFAEQLLAPPEEEERS